MAKDPRKLGGTPEIPVRADLPSAWYGKDLQKRDDWIWQVEPQHVEGEWPR